MPNDIKISLKDINIFLFKNDNAIEVRGQTEDGFIKRSFLKDDPEASAKAKELLQSIRDYHQAAINDAQAQLDEQYPELESQVDDILSGQEEQ